MTDETPVIPELNRRMLLRGGLAAGAGLAIAGLAAVGLTGVAEAATAPPGARRGKSAVVKPDASGQTQFNWAYCANCGELWYTKNNTNGYCAGQMANNGGGHVLNPSYSYELAYNVYNGGGLYQPNWNWCNRCQCLFYAPHVKNSYCPAIPFGEHHNTGGYNYSMLYNDSISGSTQDGWFWCGNCQGVFTGFKPCPAIPYGNIHSVGAGTFLYDVAYYSTSPP